MRFLLPCSAALFALVTLVVACNTVDPGDCYPNTSGGFGGSGTIPIGGAGGGSGSDRHPWKPNPCVTQGSDDSPPPPADETSSSGGTTPPSSCNQVLIGPPVTPGMGGSGAGGSGAGGDLAVSLPDGGDPGDPNSADAVSQTCMDGSELSTYIRCRGLSALACENACFEIGAYCVTWMEHPYGSMAGGLGKLRQCQSNTLNYTCTYCYPNGDVCTRVHLKGLPAFSLCSYTNGKGCE